MKALTNLKVLYVAEDGSTQAMDTWTEGDYLCFRTSHFSTYVVTGEEANGEPVQPTQPVTPSQPSQQTTTKVTKKSVKATKARSPIRATRPLLSPLLWPLPALR